MSDENNFEIVLSVKEGVLNIRHPDGQVNLVNTIYYVDLAHQILLQKSVMPRQPAPSIIPARAFPKNSTH